MDEDSLVAGSAADALSSEPNAAEGRGEVCEVKAADGLREKKEKKEKHGIEHGTHKKDKKEKCVVGEGEQKREKKERVDHRAQLCDGCRAALQLYHGHQLRDQTSIPPASDHRL